MDPKRERWLEDQKQAANEYVDSLIDVSDKLALLGTAEKEAVASNALALIDDALPIEIAPTLTPLQHKAAVLLGKGISFAETESLLGMAAGEIYQLHQQKPEFREAQRYYENVDKEQLGGAARQWVNIMLADESIDDKIRVSLLSLAQKIGMEPTDTRMKMIDKHLRAAQIESMREMGQVHGRMLGVTVTDAVDADFDVVEDDGEAQSESDEPEEEETL